MKKISKRSPQKSSQRRAVKDLEVRANRAAKVRGGDTALASGKVHVSEIQVSKVLDKS